MFRLERWKKARETSPNIERGTRWICAAKTRLAGASSSARTMTIHKLAAATNDLEKAQTRDHTTNADLSSQSPLDSDHESGTSSTSDDDDDNDWNDWIEDDDGSRGVPCVSLFDDSKHATLQDAVAYDKEKHDFDLQEVCAALKLDFYARVRLVNFLRKERPKPEIVRAFTGKEPLFSDDALMKPVIEDDPYLRMGADEWSDDEDESSAGGNGKVVDKDREIRRLAQRLEQAKRDLVDFRKLVERQFRTKEITDAAREDGESSVRPTSTTAAMTPKRDDDTHYFNSYGDNGM